MWDQAQINAIQAFYLEYGQERYVQVYEQPNYNTDKTTVFVADKYIMPAEDTTEMLQPYQKAWTPKGQVSELGRPLTTDLYKIDLEEDPRKYAKDNYLIHLRQQRTNDPYYFVPYEQWVVDGILRRWAHDIAVSLMWTGSKAAVTPGTAGDAADVTDGYLATVDDLVTATTITPIATAAMTNANAVTVIEGFVDGILDTPAKAAATWYIHTSQATILKYQRSYRANFGANTHAAMFGIQKVEGYDNVYLVPEAGMPTDALVMAKQGNLHVGDGGAPSFIIEKHKRMYYILVDGRIGFNFADVRELYVNQLATLS